jgi:ubiquinone/menaquinone biosynthesis C-methylase UbiE
MTREEREKGEQRERLRATFDQAAELYERTRPGYPPALFGRPGRPHGDQTGSRVLEIGPGTGQAMLPLAERAAGSWPPSSAPTTFLEPGDSGSVAAGR